MAKRRIRRREKASARRAIRPASIVRLRSGGPDMTVTRVGQHNGAPSAWCLWFENSKAMAGTYPLDALERVRCEKGDGPPPKCEDFYCRQPPHSVIEWVFVTPKPQPEAPGWDYRREDSQ